MCISDTAFVQVSCFYVIFCSFPLRAVNSVSARMGVWSISIRIYTWLWQGTTGNTYKQTQIKAVETVVLVDIDYKVHCEVRVTIPPQRRNYNSRSLFNLIEKKSADVLQPSHRRGIRANAPGKRSPYPHESSFRYVLWHLLSAYLPSLKLPTCGQSYALANWQGCRTKLQIRKAVAPAAPDLSSSSSWLPASSLPGAQG